MYFLIKGSCPCSIIWKESLTLLTGLTFNIVLTSDIGSKKWNEKTLAKRESNTSKHTFLFSPITEAIKSGTL